MSNIYLKVTIEAFLEAFDFLGLKNLSPCQLWGAPTFADQSRYRAELQVQVGALCDNS